MRYTPSTKKRIVILRPRKIDGCLFRIPILNLHVSYPEYFTKYRTFLTRISHEPERCRNKAFQTEDVVFYFEG